MAETRREILAFEGGCQCGAVRYAVAEGPGAMVLCHCEMCRVATGAAVPGFILVEADRVTWRGEPQVWRSSEIAERGFCGACGTSIFYRRDGRALVGLAAGSARIAFAPWIEFYAEDRPPWFEAEGLAALDTLGTRQDPV